MKLPFFRCGFQNSLLAVGNWPLAWIPLTIRLLNLIIIQEVQNSPFRNLPVAICQLLFTIGVMLKKPSLNVIEPVTQLCWKIF